MKEKITSLFFALILTINLNASDKKVGDFANQCSALFLIMTMLPDDEQWKPFVDNMSNLSETMALLSETIYDENNISLTYGELIDLRKKNLISKFKKQLKINKFDFDAICTKLPNKWL